MKLIPSYDAAIVCLQRELELYFAEIPDLQIANFLSDLPTQNKGIKTNCQDEKQRLYYWLDVTPVFDVQQVARTIADHLCQEHGLTVRLIVDRCPESVIKLD